MKSTFGITVKSALLCMGLCASVNAETISGSVAYQYNGMSQVLPFSVSEGEEVTVTEGQIPLKQGQSEVKFKLSVSSVENDNVATSYSFRLAKQEGIKRVKGLDFMEMSNLYFQGSKEVKKGQRTKIFETKNASVYLLLN